MKHFSKCIAAVASAALVFGHSTVDAFYLPGVSPTSYKKGQAVQLLVNSLDSPETAITYDYYLPEFGFCQPEGGAQDVGENLGSILAGDAIKSSPFVVCRMYSCLFEFVLESTSRSDMMEEKCMHAIHDKIT